MCLTTNTIELINSIANTVAALVFCGILLMIPFGLNRIDKANEELEKYLELPND